MISVYLLLDFLFFQAHTFFICHNDIVIHFYYIIMCKQINDVQM